MKRYNEYKDSGIKWIGEIPEGWNLMKLNFALMGLEDGTHASFERVDSIYYLLSAKNVYDTGIEVSNNESTISFDDYKAITKNGFPQKGDIVLCCVGTIGRCCIYPFDKPLAFQRSVSFLRTNELFINSFLLYILKSDVVFPQYSIYAKTSAQSGIYKNDLKNFIILRASLTEQCAIANYLDEKCGEIDELVALQEQMITELQAYKQSVITEAVTHGLNHDAKMKDSGVEWIGEIPEHWVVERIKFLTYNLDFLRQPISTELRERTNPKYDYYGASGVIDRIDNYNVNDRVLLIAEDGANLVMRNLPLVYKAKGKFWVNNHAHILKEKSMDYDYLAFTLESADYSRLITGSAQPKLTQNNLGNQKVPVPPLSEQHQIAAYLDEKCSTIDALISVKQQKIESLKEYKKSLIFECVTGKRKID